MAEWNGRRQSPPRAGGQEVRRGRRLSLPAAAEAARLARGATRAALLSWRIAHLQDTAVLLVSELVTNALQHTRAGSRTMVVLRLEATPRTLRIEVEDGDPRRPQPRRPSGLDETGFGFVLIEALSSRWGLRDTATGKAIWAELEIRPVAKSPQAMPDEPSASAADC